MSGPDKARKAAEASDFDLEAARLHPSAVFATPASLIAAVLPNSLKIELLTRWAYAEKERHVATDDGMTLDQRKNRLQEIQNAILTLEETSR
jgi:hypothetical protein